MKVKQRLFAGLLALAMLLSLNVTAFAAGPDDSTEGTLTLKKEYTAAEGVIAPAETLKFTVEAVSVTDAGTGITTTNMPMVTVADVTYTTGNTADVTVTIPSYSSVGVYTYEITETAGANGGVEYDSTPLYLKVTVTRDTETNQLEYFTAVRKGAEAEGKLEGNEAAFTNVYNTGDLNITKTVDGNLGDTNKYFEFTISLTGEVGKNYQDSYKISGGSYESNPASISVGRTATVYLKDGETVTVEDLPYGVTYKVTEDDYSAEGYETTKTDDDEGTINAATQTADFTNTKTGDVDTGVTLDSLPYIIVFAGVLAVAAVMIIRRRRVED